MKPHFAPFAAAAALLAAGAAHAQQLGPNAKGPIDISADQAEVQSKSCVTTWRGRAEALQGEARVRADVLKAIFEAKPGSGSTTGGNCGDLVRIEAQGSVYYVSAKDQRVHGDQAVYEAASDTVTVTGDVVALQGQNVLRGSRMVYNTDTGEGRMVGTATGKNAAGRPRGVFYPSKKQEGGGK
jgi:lipopolysaccharide export system protein LptA